MDLLAHLHSVLAKVVHTELEAEVQAHEEPMSCAQLPAASATMVKQTVGSLHAMLVAVVLSPVAAALETHLQLPVARAVHSASVADFQDLTTVAPMTSSTPSAAVLQLAACTSTHVALVLVVHLFMVPAIAVGSPLAPLHTVALA